MERRRTLHGSTTHSLADFVYSLELLDLPDQAVWPEVNENSDDKKTIISEQNNLKESDIFSKLALEIEATNALHKRNEFVQINANKSPAMNCLSGLNIYQSNDNTDEFVASDGDANDSVESNDNSGLDVKYLDTSPGCSLENVEVKWPVCNKYPECPICTIDIEQPDVQRVSVSSCFRIQLRMTGIRTANVLSQRRSLSLLLYNLYF